MSILNNSSYYGTAKLQVQSNERIATLKAKMEEMQASLEAEKADQVELITQKIDSLHDEAKDAINHQDAEISSLETTVMIL